MLTKRNLLFRLPTVLVAAKSANASSIKPELPQIVLTFDEWPEATTTAFDIMASHGLIGTYFATPELIGTARGPSIAAMLGMKERGWEIGVYGSSGVSGQNFVHLQAVNSTAANLRLLALKDGMAAKGFPVKSIAPSQRAWNLELRNLSDGIFERVRAPDTLRSVTGRYQQTPVQDLLWVREGGSQSLSSKDTVVELAAGVADLTSLGGVWIVVIHRVSDDNKNPLYTINTNIFSGFCAKIANEVAAGTLRCVRFCDI